MCIILCFFFQAEDGIRDWSVTGVQTCALPISSANTRGRIYNFRIGLRADWPRVFAEASKLDKALEVEIGRASCRERVEILVVAGSLKKKCWKVILTDGCVRDDLYGMQ